MDIHSIDPPWPVKVFAWFVVTWPFVAAASMRSRVRSAAPLVAMVVPIAVATACAFASLGLVLEDLSISGAAPHVAAPGVRMARSLIRNRAERGAGGDCGDRRGGNSVRAPRAWQRRR